MARTPARPTTDNILDLYMWAAGKGECPDQWHRWTCLTMIAAAVSDRVFFYREAWKPLYPNLFTFLIGPSGLGKNHAIGWGMEFEQTRMNRFYGSTTYKSMVDLFSNKKNKPQDAGPSKMLLITPELSASIGQGLLADAFAKQMTDWYTGEKDEKVESTRAHGINTYDTPCLSWLAGTTADWLSDTVDAKALFGGFLGRINMSIAKSNFDKRSYRTIQPEGWQATVDELKERFEELTYLKGQMTMTEQAEAIDEAWYMERPAPESELMEPFWRREPVLVNKLAMIMSLSDSMDLVIDHNHLAAAFELVQEARESLPEVIRLATATKNSQNHDRVAYAIQKEGSISRADLQRRIGPYHIRAKELDAILETLKQEMMVRIEMKPTGGKVYHWLGGDTIKIDPNAKSKKKRARKVSPRLEVD